MPYVGKGMLLSGLEENVGSGLFLEDHVYIYSSDMDIQYTVIMKINIHSVKISSPTG